MPRQERYKNMFRFGMNILELCMQTGIWAYFWMTEYSEEIFRPFGYKGNWLVFVVYGIVAFFFALLYGGYRIGYYSQEDVVLSGFISIFFTNSITYLQTCLVGRAIMDLLPFVWMTLAHALSFYFWAVLAGGLYARAFPPYKMLMVYGGSPMASNLVQKMSKRSEKYIIQEVISIDAGIDEVHNRILQYKSIVLCDVPTMERNLLVKLCFKNDIRTYITPKISDVLMRSAGEVTLFDTPLLLSRNNGLSLEQLFFKRTIDILFALVMLIITSPFLIVVAVAVKCGDGGPVLYRQERLTQNGRHFFLCKFRSMIVNAEKENGAQLSTRNDDRITKVGRLIRKIRLDELPQLWNILVGDMSVVGPRPERPELAAEHLKTMPEFDYRLKVRAGLTGYAQVVGKYNTTAYDKLKMDLIYISGYSLVLDFKIMFMTFKILFKSDSTEGV